MAATLKGNNHERCDCGLLPRDLCIDPEDGSRWAKCPWGHMTEKEMEKMVFIMSGSEGDGKGKLQSLDAFNAKRRTIYGWFAKERNNPRPNGISCPVCEKELVDSIPNITLSSNPPQKNVHCPACGYNGYRVA